MSTISEIILSCDVAMKRAYSRRALLFRIVDASCELSGALMLLIEWIMAVGG